MYIFRYIDIDKYLNTYIYIYIYRERERERERERLREIEREGSRFVLTGETNSKPIKPFVYMYLS